MIIDFLIDLDEREKIIIGCIFEKQLQDPKGISWGELLKMPAIRGHMSRQTFSNRLKGLIERGIVKKERMKNKRGNPVLYSLEPRFFAELKEVREKIYPWEVRRLIENLIKDIKPLRPSQYVEAIMEVIFSRLNVLAISLLAFDREGARWIFYESAYGDIEFLLRKIIEKASESKENKEEILLKLFEILEGFAERPLGKRFQLDEVCKAKKEIIKLITNY